ncbi:MAG: type IV secretory system conjugative DNA transfer family protein [Acidimicrobiia bacterium]|nr:type IV secretory system conjugative DNA transfer family protein [Acidimicrobiia bacterium]
MERDGLSPFEWLVLAVAAVGAVLVGAVWGGASLAMLVGGGGGGLPFSAAVDAAIELPARVADPSSAWPPPHSTVLPGPVVYWLCTGLVASAMAAVVGLGVRWLGRSRIGTSKRNPLGVDARPQFASRRELAPLLVSGPSPGRFVVARFGRSLIATESTPAGGGSNRRGQRRGDRGALALIGPSRSGKTTAAVSGILEWEGPAVLSSVKADLLAVTYGWRSEQGSVRVFDPTGSTGISGTQSARWSPLQQASTVVGAQRAARALCDAAPRAGVDGGMDFWLAQAEILLSGLMYVAFHAHRDMGAVCEWVLLKDHPAAGGPGEVRVAIDSLFGSRDSAVVSGALEVSKALLSIWELDERTRSSVYSTAQTIVWPWSEPGVAASAARGKFETDQQQVDLRWLLGGSNTVYLCAPIEDQRRLAPAFGGLLNDLINQAYRHVAETGEPLDPPLLVVIDEAGNTPLKALPEYASTLAGIGVVLVTIWQSLAQIDAAYGRQADTILTNHLTKCFYAGLSDPASIRYVSQVLGDAEVDTRSRSASERAGGASEQFSTTRVALAPAHTLRQMRPGDALLIHGTLPPAHVRTRPFYRDKELARRAGLKVTNGKEVAS